MHRHFIGLGSFCILAASAAATDWKVDVTAATNGPGNAWTNAFNNLQSALANPVLFANDTIWIADGVYKPTATTITGDPRSATFRIQIEGIKLYGGFQGLSRPGGPEDDVAQRDPEQFETVLSGDINPLGPPGGATFPQCPSAGSCFASHESTAGCDNANCCNTVCNVEPFCCDTAWDVSCAEIALMHCATQAYHVVTVNPGLSLGTTFIDGLTIRDGFASGPVSGQHDRGGGMWVRQSAPRIVRCRFINNTASGGGESGAGGGGALWLGAAGTEIVPARVINCTFRDNASLNLGGGALNQDLLVPGSVPTHALYVNCLFHDNRAARSGGGMCNAFSTVTVINSTFSQNLADAGGGSG